MTFKLGISFAERRFCFVAILISTFTPTLRAQSASMQPGSLNQEKSSLCRLRIPDTIPQSTADAEEGTMTDGALAYTPVRACRSSRSRSHLPISHARFASCWPTNPKRLRGALLPPDRTGFDGPRRKVS
jgi:hypothetical protein